MSARKQPFPKAAHGTILEAHQIIASALHDALYVMRNSGTSGDQAARIEKCGEVVHKLHQLDGLVIEMEAMVRKELM